MSFSFSEEGLFEVDGCMCRYRDGWQVNGGPAFRQGLADLLRDGLRLAQGQVPDKHHFQVAGAVGALVECPQVFRADGVHALNGAAQRVAIGMALEQMAKRLAARPEPGAPFA